MNIYLLHTGSLKDKMDTFWKEPMTAPQLMPYITQCNMINLQGKAQCVLPKEKKKYTDFINT